MDVTPLSIYNTLLDHYGDLHWWLAKGDRRFDIVVRF